MYSSSNPKSNQDKTYGLTIQNLGERSSHFRLNYGPYTYPSWPPKSQGFKDKFESTNQGKIQVHTRAMIEI